MFRSDAFIAFILLTLCVGCASRQNTKPTVLLTVYDSRATLNHQSRELNVDIEVGMQAASHRSVETQPFFPGAFCEAEENPWIISWPIVQTQEPTAERYTKIVSLSAQERRFWVNLSRPLTIPENAPPITNGIVWFSIRYNRGGITSNPVRFNLHVQ